MKAPKPLANSRTLALRRSARSCGRLVRFREPVWMSTSPSHWRMMLSKSDAAIRDAELPVTLPGKYRLRSRRSGRYREPRRNPCRLTMGTPITAPFTRAGSRSWSTRRIISMPLSSSPWMAPVRHSVGPLPTPFTTRTGDSPDVPSKAWPPDHSRRRLVPGGTVIAQQLQRLAAPGPRGGGRCVCRVPGVGPAGGAGRRHCRAQPGLAAPARRAAGRRRNR